MEKNLRDAKDPQEKIAIIEDLIAIMPKHKGTDHLKAELRSRIAKLSQQAEKTSGVHRAATVIPKEGAGQVAGRWIDRRWQITIALLGH